MRKMTLDEKKKVSLDILKDIDAICKLENIKYYLAYGTLLGAIRHDGFIPWDDDVDIWIKADYYWKFAEIMKKSKYDVLFYPYNNGWNMQFIKISNINTVIKDGDTWSKRGVAVDVFPLVENYSWLLPKLVNASYWYREIPGFLEGMWRRRIKKLFTKIIPEDLMYYLLKKELSKKKSNGLLYSVFSPYSIEKDTYRREWFETSSHDFEGLEFTIPQNYDAVLTQLYGCYMILPAEQDRNSGHDVEAYWKE